MTEFGLTLELVRLFHTAIQLEGFEIKAYWPGNMFVRKKSVVEAWRLKFGGMLDT